MLKISKPSASAKSDKRGILFLLLFVLVIVGIDQWTKQLVSQGHWSASWIRPILNSGISFSIALPDWATWVLIIGIIIWLAFDVVRRQGSRLEWIVLGVIIGGAASNLVDRIRLGAVYDWISVPFFSVFNLADTAIVVGLAVLLLITWRHSHEARENTRNP